MKPPHRLLRLPTLQAALLSLSVAAQPAPSPSSADPAENPSDPAHKVPMSVFDRGRFMNEASSHYVLSHPSQAGTSVLFFPPVTPALGSEAPAVSPIEAGIPAPPELAAYVNDLFYPQLGARLAAGELPKALRDELQAYGTKKAALQDELRSRISELMSADPKYRDRLMAAFAQLQTPQIVDVENSAERLRENLLWSGALRLLSGDGDWTPGEVANVSAGQNASATASDLWAESEALRRAAYYQEGFSTAQRRLICEAADEAAEQAKAKRADFNRAGSEQTVHFSPEPARIPFPPNLPDTLKSRQIKAELVDALRRTNEGSGVRAEAIRRLAAAQAARIAAVEETAEQIRRELAALPSQQGPPTAPALPADLVARISVYRAHKLQLLHTLRAMLDTPPHSAGAAPAQRAANTAEGGGGTSPWTRDGTSATEVQPTTLKVSVEEFDRKQNALLSALNKEQAGIREAITEYVRSTDQPAYHKSMNDLLRDFEDARQKQEIWENYRDYQTAALMPGLSPEQRRLLFDAAVQQLALPLPSGETVR